jgi:hypothetical protein
MTPRRPRLSRAAAASLALAIGGLLAATARAAAPITVQVTQIQASGREGGPKDIDPSLASLASQLETTGYHRFRKIGQEARAVPEGQPAAFALEGGLSMRVSAAPAGAGWVLLDVSIRDAAGAERLSTKLKLKDGGTVLIAKDFEAAEGRLYVALTVKR